MNCCNRNTDTKFQLKRDSDRTAPNCLNLGKCVKVSPQNPKNFWSSSVFVNLCRSIIPVAIQTFLAALTDPSSDDFTHNDLKLLITTTLRNQQLFKPKSIIFTQLRERLGGTPWFDRLTHETQQVSFSEQCTFLIYECSFINLYIQSLFSFFFPPVLHNYNLQNVNIYEFTGCSLEEKNVILADFSCTCRIHIILFAIMMY